MSFAASPTRLKMFDDAKGGCRRQYYFNYMVRGERAPRDPKAVHSRVLGTFVHKLLERFYTNGTKLTVPIDDSEWSWREKREIQEAIDIGVELDAIALHAPIVAQSGLAFLPTPSEVLQSVQEAVIEINIPGFEDVPWSDMSRIDFVFQYVDKNWVSLDYKTTRGTEKDPWFYVPSVETLRQDVQVLATSLCVMQKTRTQVAHTRWLYLSSRVQDACTRDITMTWDEAVEGMRYWMQRAREAQAFELENPSLDQIRFPADLLSPDSPCKAYRGCANKGVCKPPDGKWSTLDMTGNSNYNPNVNPFYAMAQNNVPAQAPALVPQNAAPVTQSFFPDTGTAVRPAPTAPVLVTTAAPVMVPAAAPTIPAPPPELEATSSEESASPPDPLALLLSGLHGMIPRTANTAVVDQLARAYMHLANARALQIGARS